MRCLVGQSEGGVTELRAGEVNLVFGGEERLFATHRCSHDSFLPCEKPIAHWRVGMVGRGLSMRRLRVHLVFKHAREWAF